MEEVKKKNMVRETQISRGNYRKEVKVTEISAGVSINARGPINVEIESSKRPAWLSMIEGRENVNITEVRGESKGWDRKTRTLTPQAQMVIGTAVTAATAGVGGAVGAGAVGSAIAAGVSGFASSMVVGTINNGGNVGKGLKSATSKESLRSLGKDMLTAGVITGVMNGTGFGDVAARAKDGGVAGRNQGIFERVLLRTTVNTAIKGGSLRDNFKSEALRGALAVGQGYIGDIGQRYGLSEGGAAKVMMHSALGGTYALASKGNVAIGMLDGGMGEALSGLTSPESSAHAFSGTGESGTGLSNWNDTIVAATAMLAGGSASDISTATTISSSVVEYNRRLHEDETYYLSLAKESKSPEEQERLDAAALRAVGGEKGLESIDPQRLRIASMVNKAEDYAEEHELLKKIAIEHGHPEAFEYGKLDAIKDFVASHNMYDS